MQKKWLLFITLLIMLILTATTVVFAWFTLVERTQPILIYSGSIKLNANLYEIKADNNEEEINTSKVFNNVIPGDVFNFKLVVKNDGSLDGDLEVKFNFKSNEEVLKEYFQINYLEETQNFNTPFIIESFLKGKTETIILFSVSVLTTLKNDMITIGDFVSIENILISLTQSNGVNNNG